MMHQCGGEGEQRAGWEQCEYNAAAATTTTPYREKSPAGKRHLLICAVVAVVCLGLVFLRPPRPSASLLATPPILAPETPAQARGGIQVKTERSSFPFNTTTGSSPHRRALKYLIEEPDLCSRHPDLDILTYVHSSISQVQNRQLIRDTWGSIRYYPLVRMLVVFVFGRAVGEEEELIVQQESREHHDVIQLDYHDSYKNLSYKGLGALQWVTEHCLTPRWVLKTDDDMLINVFALADFLRHATLPSNSLLCAVWYNMPVLRDGACSKWCVSKEEWPDETFPVYCSGSAFVMPTGIVPRLYRAHSHQPFLWVDDAYITGVLPMGTGVEHYAITSLYELYFGNIVRSMLQGSMVFYHHPGEAKARAGWWPLIAAKEGQEAPLFPTPEVML